MDKKNLDLSAPLVSDDEHVQIIHIIPNHHTPLVALVGTENPFTYQIIRMFSIKGEAYTSEGIRMGLKYDLKNTENN